MPGDSNKTKAQLIEELRALRESQERYHALFYRSKDAIYLSTLDGWIIDANDAMLQLLGYDRAEIPNLNFASFLNEQQLAFALNAIEHLRVTGVQEEPREYALRRKDGSWVTVETLASLLYRDGKPYAVHGVARDLTHRRSIEEALRESEERFRLAYQCSNDIIYERNLRTGEARFFSDMDTPLGYAEGEFPLSMEGWGGHIHPDDLEPALTSLRESVQDGKPFSIEYRLRRKDGSYTHWHDRGIAVSGADGLPQKVVGAATNITERKQSEQALLESEERSRTLMEAAFEGIGISEKSRMIEVNSALCRILGYTREECLGAEIRKFIVPEEVEMVLSRNLSGYAEPYEHRMIRKDGAIIDVEVFGAPILFQGRVCRGTAIRDITDRKRAEQERAAAHDYLANIVNAIGDPVFVKDSEHRFVLVNDAFCGMTGYSREELLGKTDTEFFPAEQTAVFWEIDSQVLDTGGENVNEEIISDPRMTEPRTMVTRKTRYVDPSGRRFIVGVSTDITVRIQAEKTAANFSAQMTVLHELSNDLSRAETFDDLCRQAVELGRSRLGFPRLSIWFWDKSIKDGTDTSGMIYGSFGTSATGETTDERNLCHPVGQIPAEIARTGKRFNRMQAQPLRDGQGVNLGVGTQVSALLWDGAAVSGCIYADDLPNPGSLTEMQAELLALFAATIGHLCSRKRAEDRVRESADRIRRQNQTIANLSTSLASRGGEIEKVAGQLTEIVGAIFGIERVGVWLFDPTRTELRCVDLYETTPKRHSSGTLLAEAQYRNEFRAFKSARYVDAYDALTDPRTAGYADTYLRPFKIASMLNASILVGGRTVGVLGLEHVGIRHHWEPDEIAFACQLADQIGIAVSNRERRHAEEARQLLEAQVRHTQKLESLGVLAGGIAHDFNNILMAILGNAELALFELSEVSPARPGIEEIGKAARRAAELTRQMLAYSGKGHFEIRPVDLSEITGEMAHLLEVSISKKTILRMDLAKDLPAVSGDVAQLQQVIMNLIVNASESIDQAQGGVVVVRTGKEYCTRAYLEQSRAPEKPHEGNYVYLDVSDTGHGMDGVTIERLFDPFFTTKFTGRGLGMSAVLGIMRGHGGGILVDSAPGKGTTIRVLFPALDTFAPAAPRLSAGRATAEWKASGTILVVDDEEAVRKMLALMLGRSGFEALTAADGLSAIGVFRERGAEIACIILDLSMPHMDGAQTLHELRRIRRDVPIILSSGYSESELEERFRGEGVAAFLQKPFQFQALYDALNTVLGGEKQSGDTP